LLSGSRVELRVVPDVVPAVPSPDTANVARGIADNKPAKSSEVILMFIMVVSMDESLPEAVCRARASAVEFFHFRRLAKSIVGGSA
jgi:hypothetical protein